MILFDGRAPEVTGMAGPDHPLAALNEDDLVTVLEAGPNPFTNPGARRSPLSPQLPNARRTRVRGCGGAAWLGEGRPSSKHAMCMCASVPRSCANNNDKHAAGSIEKVMMSAPQNAPKKHSWIESESDTERNSGAAKRVREERWQLADDGVRFRVSVRQMALPHPLCLRRPRLQSTP